jgi:ribonuclease P protein component
VEQHEPRVCDNRFPRHARLLNSRDFQHVFEHREYKSSDRFLTLLACRNQRDDPRLGLAITKKKINTAVARHHLKRVIRESFRQHKQQLAGLDIIVMGTKQAQDAPNTLLFKQLQHHWRKLAEQLAQACKSS